MDYLMYLPFLDLGVAVYAEGQKTHGFHQKYLRFLKMDDGLRGLEQQRVSN